MFVFLALIGWARSRAPSPSNSRHVLGRIHTLLVDLCITMALSLIFNFAGDFGGKCWFPVQLATLSYSAAGWLGCLVFVSGDGALLPWKMGSCQ